MLSWKLRRRWIVRESYTKEKSNSRDKSILTCKRFPMATNGWTSPLVPTISITIWSGGKNRASSVSAVPLSKSPLYNTPVPKSRLWCLISPGTSNFTVPSSWMVANRFNHLSCQKVYEQCITFQVLIYAINSSPRNVWDKCRVLSVYGEWTKNQKTVIFYERK